MDVKTAYEQWLHDFAADADTIADLKAINSLRLFQREIAHLYCILH